MKRRNCSLCSAVAAANGIDRYANSVRFIPKQNPTMPQSILFVAYRHITNSLTTPELLGKITIDALTYLRSAGITEYEVTSKCTPELANKHACVYVTVPPAHALVPAFLHPKEPTGDTEDVATPTAC